MLSVAEVVQAYFGTGNKIETANVYTEINTAIVDSRGLWDTGGQT